jgi:adenosine deaminase
VALSSRAAVKEPRPKSHLQGTDNGAKSEIHCHIEGAASPELVIEQARKYGADVSGFIRDGSFVWDDFTSFLAAYDAAADLFRTEEDYALLAETYLVSLAADGAIYSEFFTSPDHARSRRPVARGLYERPRRGHPPRQGEDRHRGPHDRHRRAPFRRRVGRRRPRASPPNAAIRW